MLVLLVFVSALSAVTARTCTKVNGISGACNLRLNYFTLAGTHNSGAGAFGLLYWWSGGAAPSCYVRNQDKSITQQLELGIRYFDFDMAHIDPKYGQDDWWEPGLVLVHCGDSGCAYSRSLRRAMEEVEAFLDKNKDEIVVIRMKDHPEDSREFIRNNLRNELGRFISGRAKVKLNRNSNPLLGDAIARNERLVIYVNGGFYPQSPLHPLNQVESYTGASATAGCFSVADIVNKLTADSRSSYDNFPLQVDWYHAFGLCLWDLAGLCDGDELHKLVTINKEIVKKTRRPINLVMIDYAGRGSLRLADVVREINEYNVEMFT